MFGKKKETPNTISINVPAFIKELVDGIIGALCEKFVTRADVESIVLETIERVNACKQVEEVVVEETPVVEEVVTEEVRSKTVPRIVGHPRPTNKEG